MRAASGREGEVGAQTAEVLGLDAGTVRGLDGAVALRWDAMAVISLGAGEVGRGGWW